MKKKYKYLVLITFFIACNSARFNQTKYDKKVKSEILTEECNRKAFNKEPFKLWFDKEYSSYKTNDSIINILKNTIKGKNIKVLCVFGSWCSDSRREIPRFYKIADKICLRNSQITLVGVGRDKFSKHKMIKNLVIDYVPIFIFYENNIEKGKIIESTKKSFEEDFLKIFSEK